MREHSLLPDMNGTTAAPRGVTEVPRADLSEIRYESEVEILLVVLYLIITLGGLVLNGIILYLFLGHRLKKNSFHEYLLSLTISDFLSLLSIYPYILVDVNQLGISQKAADILCSFTDGMTMFWVCTSSSICTLCLISLNRYLLVNHPKRCVYLRSVRFVRVSIAASWFLSVIFMIPNTISYHFNKAANLCIRRWPDGFNGILYTYASCAIGVGIPLVIMVYTLLATIRTLWFTKKTTLKNGSVMKARKRVVVMLATLIGAFACCYFPFAVYWLLSGSGAVFSKGIPGNHERNRVIRVVALFLVINPVLDPLIYGLRSFEIRRALKNMANRKQSVMSSRSFYSHSDNESRESRFSRHSTKRKTNVVIVNTAAVTSSVM